MAEEDDIRRDFEAKGEAAVRDNLQLGRYSGKKLLLAQQWLAVIDEDRRAAFDGKESDRAEDNLRVAKRSRTAMWVSAVMSILAFIISVIALIQSSQR